MTDTDSNSIIAGIAIGIVETDLLLAVKLVSFRWYRAKDNNGEELQVSKQNKQWVKANIAKQGSTKINIQFKQNKTQTTTYIYIE